MAGNRVNIHDVEELKNYAGFNSNYLLCGRKSPQS